MMISRAKDNIAVISLTRVLAMWSIIACHICRYYGSECANWLNVGVRLFFIISGFLYGNRVIDEPIRWIEECTGETRILYYILLLVIMIGHVLAVRRFAGSVPGTGCLGPLSTRATWEVCPR